MVMANSILFFCYRKTIQERVFWIWIPQRWSLFSSRARNDSIIKKRAWWRLKWKRQKFVRTRSVSQQERRGANTTRSLLSFLMILLKCTNTDWSTKHGVGDEAGRGTVQYRSWLAWWSPTGCSSGAAPFAPVLYLVMVFWLQRFQPPRHFACTTSGHHL